MALRFNKSIFDQLIRQLEGARGAFERGEINQDQYNISLNAVQNMARTNPSVFGADSPYSEILKSLSVAPPAAPSSPSSPTAPPPVAPPVPRTTPPSEIDQGLIETEAGRQEAQRRTQLSQLLGIPEAELGDMRGLLQRQQEETFRRRIPQIAEESQAAGLLRGSGFTDSLAREARELETDTSLALGGYGISGLADALAARQGLQTAGLQRRFSLEDFDRSARLAREIGATSAPGVQSGKGGSVLSGAVGGGSIGAGFGPVGAGIGAVTGGVLGAVTGRKGK